MLTVPNCRVFVILVAYRDDVKLRGQKRGVTHRAAETVPDRGVATVVAGEIVTQNAAGSVASSASVLAHCVKGNVIWDFWQASRGSGGVLTATYMSFTDAG